MIPAKLWGGKKKDLTELVLSYLRVEQSSGFFYTVNKGSFLPTEDSLGTH